MLFIPEFKIIYVYRELKNVLAPDKVKVNDAGAMFYVHTHTPIHLCLFSTCTYVKTNKSTQKMHNT